MSEPSDGGKPVAAAAPDANPDPAPPGAGGDDVAAAVAPAEPDAAASATELGAKLSYPDDGALARWLRRIDDQVGRAEQVLLVAILACVVLTAASHALLDRFAHYQVPFKEQVIRAGTFAIAMLGAAFASHQSRHLSMDLVSRRLSARARLFLRVILALFVIGVVALLVRAGFHVIDKEREFTEEAHLLSSVRIAYLIPIGGGLVIFHTLLHAIIDLEYIVRGKTPPERMRSAH